MSYGLGNIVYMLFLAFFLFKERRSTGEGKASILFRGERGALERVYDRVSSGFMCTSVGKDLLVVIKFCFGVLGFSFSFCILDFAC